MGEYAYPGPGSRHRHLERHASCCHRLGRHRSRRSTAGIHRSQPCNLVLNYQEELPGPGETTALLLVSTRAIFALTALFFLVATDRSLDSCDNLALNYQEELPGPDEAPFHPQTTKPPRPRSDLLGTTTITEGRY